jgi:hypothetical protein
MGSNAAKAELGCALNTIFKLVHLGVLEAVRRADAEGGSAWIFYIVPGIGRIGHYDAWVRRVLQWNHRTAKRHKDVRGACVVPEDHPKPDGLDDFLCRTFSRIGVSRREEVIPYYADPGRRAVDRDRIREKMASGDWRRAKGLGSAPMEPRLIPLRFPALAGLPDTCLDPAAEAEEPTRKVVGRTMGLQYLSSGATMFVLAAAASGRSEKLLRNYTRSFEAIETRLRLLRTGEGTGESIQMALLAMLAEARRAGRGSTALVEACEFYRAAERYLRGYVSVVDSDGRRGLSSLILPALPEPERVRAQLVKAKAAVGERGGSKRKHLSNRAASQLGRHSAAARHALEQVAAIMEASATASEDLKRHLQSYDALDEHVRARTPAFVEMLVPTTVLDPRGNLVRGASQTLVFWVWRERDAWLSLEAGALRRQRGMRPRKACKDGPTIAERGLVEGGLAIKLKDVRANADAYDRTVFEFRGCIAGEGSQTCEPRFVTLLRHGVDGAADQLSARQQRRRHRLMENWNVVPTTTMPSGLLTSPWALQAMRVWMLSRERVLVPVTETYFATLLGTLGFDIVRETLVRISEAIQPEQDLDRWEEDSAPGEPTIGYLASFKAARNKPVGPPRPVIVSEALFDRIMETGEVIAIANGHADGELPDVDPPPGRPREANGRGEVLEPRPGPVVFQWEGRALRPEEVGALIRWIMSNRGHVTPHVLRHAGANELREMGVAERLIQAILRHGSPKMTFWYASRSVQQARRGHATRGRNHRIDAAHAMARGLRRTAA